jgi:predicted TIM-barrel fold metal-dependent hydrolase
MRIVDSQIHLFDTRNPAAAERVGQHSVPPEQIVTEMDAAGVDRAFLVPSSSGANQACLDTAANWPGRFAVMGTITLNKPENRSLPGGWKAAGYTGVRLTFPPFRDPSWLRDGTADWFWPVAAAHDLPVMVWAPQQLDELAGIAERNPGLRLVIDHLNFYVEDKGHVAVELAKRLTALSRFPNVAVKASALPAHSLESFPYRDILPAVQIAYDAFGSDRVFWGTDFTRLPCTLGQAIAMFTEHLDFLPAGDLQKIMGEGILRWVGWPDAVLPESGAS